MGMKLGELPVWLERRMRDSRLYNGIKWGGDGGTSDVDETEVEETHLRLPWIQKGEEARSAAEHFAEEVLGAKSEEPELEELPF